MGIRPEGQDPRTDMTQPRHIPVLLEPCIELLAPALTAPGAVVVDGTVGLGGHAEALLARFPELRLVGIDRDPTAIALSAERLARFGSRVMLVPATYDQIITVLAEAGLRGPRGILLDLGVSSMQLDEASRGFAYSRDAPLDMRMDSTSPLTAERIVAEYSEDELRRIFREYGEEKLAGRYARRIVTEREHGPLRTSRQLVDLIAAATPAARQRSGHPAKRVFQALRIEVNQELAILERAIPQALTALAPGGRLVVMSYQSLEDRIVKNTFAAATRSTAPRGLPVELPEHRAKFRLLLRGAELADAAEIAANPRAASVRLRAVERLAEAA